MNHDVLKTCLAAVQANPRDCQAWLQLAGTAEAQQDLQMAHRAYVTALCLQPEPQVEQAWAAVHAKYIAALQDKPGLQLDSFRLPGKRAFVIVAGTINMEVQQWEKCILALISSGIQEIVMDFSGVTVFSGLGPATIKRFLLRARESGSVIKFLLLPSLVQTVFQLKKIVCENYQSPRVIFNSKAQG